MAKKPRYVNKTYKHEYEVALRLTPQQNAFFQLFCDLVDTKTNKVKPDELDKIAIMEKIGSTAKDPKGKANDIILELIKKDVMRTVVRGSYMLNPRYRDSINSGFSTELFEEQYKRL